MNLKKEAAREAVSFITNGSSVGLGMGSTMAYMVECLKVSTAADIQLYSSSSATKELLLQNNFIVNDIADVSGLDLYFDGCDGFDKDLNALKSGGGIHTTEKIFASMAKEFILVGDESKYMNPLSTQFPVVIEILPQALHFIITKLYGLFGNIKAIVRRSNTTNNIIITEYNNYLIDIWFNTLPPLSEINPLLKSITGVVETSLFYNMASKAIIAGTNGVQILQKR